jgi:hypothetical protein
MKALLALSVLIAAGASAANAEDYPPCSASVTDKCIQHGGGHHMMKHHMMKHHKMHGVGHHKMKHAEGGDMKPDADKK